MQSSIFLLIPILVLQVLIWRRGQGKADQTLETALREEQRHGRAELREQLETLSRQQEARMQAFTAQLLQLQQHVSAENRKNREETNTGQQRFADAVGQRLQELTTRNEQRITEMRQLLETRLHELQADNAEKLEQMRSTVDEKLQSTLTSRLDSSFGLISQRLEQVQRGLGEMQQLATGVGDLKRIMASVKNRGSWGEVQLDNILEQTLTAEQYARNVSVCPNRNERVDFAVRLPGQRHDEQPLWLPLDSKFPLDDYQRLLDAQDNGDHEAARAMGQQLERALRTQAKSISQKYIVPPYTTDFAVMFLPTEGLYAEAIRRAGLVDALQREHRIVMAGPTTVTALLNSLQMGFRTLAIEKRSSEVWTLLGAVKTEFGKFGAVLEKAEKQVSSVSRSLGDAGRRTRAIERQLRHVETLPAEQAQALIDDELPENPP